jgi:hypothetical protein
MDFYTKLFLANMVAMVFTATMDRNVFNDALEGLPFVGLALKLWAFVSLCTIPVWLFYIIITG